MTGEAPDWWRERPRRITLYTDAGSWITPWVDRLRAEIERGGDAAFVHHDYDEAEPSAAAFFLGCTRLAGPDVLARHHRNLVVHESALPKGRGFAPVAWQIIEGANEIPIRLIEAVDGPADSGPIVLSDSLRFDGTELFDEIRRAQGEATIALCLRFLQASSPPEGAPQEGEPSYYPRRRPADSELDPARSLAEQFDLLRTVDDRTHPAFFRYRGARYRLSIRREEE